MQLLKMAPYYLVTSFFVMALLLAACNGSGLGSGGEDISGSAEEPLPGVTNEPSPEITEASIASEKAVQKGSIESVDLEVKRITLRLPDSGETTEAYIDEYLTEVTVNSAGGTLQDLRPGYSAEAESDQATGIATSIVIEGSGGGY